MTNLPLTFIQDKVKKQFALTDFSDMQKEAFSTILDKKDTILLAPTGSGKTLAYLLPVLAQIDVDNDNVQAIVIVPSRELAIQTTQVMTNAKIGVRSMEVYGGRPTMEEHRRLRDLLPQIIIGTPGRLLDHLAKENIKPYAVNCIVLDEFDKCLELGFTEEMSAVFSYFPHLSQRILTSATTLEELPSFLNFSANGTVLDHLTTRDKSNNITSYAVYTSENDKLYPLAQLLTQIGQEQSIVFVNYRESVERIVSYLQTQGFVCGGFHGKLDQQERERVFYRFRSGGITVLISTDLSARGLDVSDVKHIIHYHLPLTLETYIHRSGRTGRWDKSGNSYLLLNPREHSFIQDHGIEALTYDLPQDAPVAPQRPLWTTLYIGRGKKDKLSKSDILGFLCKKGNLNASHIGLIDVKDHQAYASVLSTKVKSALALLSDAKIKGMKTKIEEMRH